jgi:hypothetical protein
MRAYPALIADFFGGMQSIILYGIGHLCSRKNGLQGSLAVTGTSAADPGNAFFYALRPGAERIETLCDK